MASSTLNQPWWGRAMNSLVQSVLTFCLVNTYLQTVIPIGGVTIPAWSIWTLDVPAWTLWSAFNLSFQTTCTADQVQQYSVNGLGSFSVCTLPWTYQSLIFGAFIGSYGHLINDSLYRSVKTAQVTGAGGLVASTINEDDVEVWHNNFSASIETLSLGSTTGLIAALATQDWGVQGEVITWMRLIVQVMIMTNYLIQGIMTIQPLLSLILVVWTYIIDIENIWGWIVFVNEWTLSPLWWCVTFLWARLCCIESILTCQCCASTAPPDGKYTEVPAHDAL